MRLDKNAFFYLWASRQQVAEIQSAVCTIKTFDTPRGGLK
jgi:hypothetical protein